MTARAALKLLLAAALLGAAAAACPAADILPDFSLDRLNRRSFPKFRENNIPPVPPPSDTGYYSGRWRAFPRLDGVVRVAEYGPSRRAVINFPAPGSDGPRDGYRTALFVRLLTEGDSRVLSWAAVVCAGGRYLGYKGASLRLLPDGTAFSLTDHALALGPLGTRLRLTHPWLGADAPLDELCSRQARGRHRPAALPERAGKFLISYDGGDGSLCVTRGK